MQYNGWTNKETWLVSLWLGDIFVEMQESGETVTSDTVRNLVVEFAESVLGSESDVESAFIGDLLSCALCEINYSEIASFYQISES